MQDQIEQLCYCQQNFSRINVMTVAPKTDRMVDKGAINIW